MMQRCHVIPERRGLWTLRMMGRHEEEAVKNRMNMDDEEETTVSDEERKQNRSGP